MPGSSTKHDKEEIYNKYIVYPWYGKIFYFMLYLQCPPNLNKSEYRSLKLKALKYVLIDQILYWKHLGGILFKCLDRSEADVVTVELMEVHVEVTSTRKKQHLIL